MGGKEIVLAIKGLSVRYPSRSGFMMALEDFSLELRHGEIAALVGESGSGKSTALMAALGLLPGNAAAEGSVTHGGSPISAWDQAALSSVRRAGGIGLVIQEPMASFNPLMRVRAQVIEALALRPDASKLDLEAKLAALFEEVGLKDAPRIAASYPHQLSGGQLQRVMIAMALARDPDVLLADEPTAALDLAVQRKILTLLKRLRDARDMAILMVSHDISMVESFADRIIVLRGGRIVEEGHASKLCERPKADYTRLLLCSRPGAHEPGSLIPIGDPTEVGKKGSKALPRKIGKSLAVKAESLCARYQGGFLKHPFVALKEASFRCHEGETLGVVGESGSGKSSLGKVLAGILPPFAGRLEIMGRLEWLDGRKMRVKVRPSCQMVFQNSHGSLNRGLSIRAILAEASRFAGLSDKARIEEEAIARLEEVGLGPDMLDRYSAQLSGGQRQRVNIARALTCRPAVLVCDEAVSALDASVQAGILNLLLRIRSERGLTIIFISHDMEVVRHVSDRVAIMDEGRIVEEGKAEKIYKDPQHKATRILIESMHIKKGA